MVANCFLNYHNVFRKLAVAPYWTENLFCTVVGARQKRVSFSVKRVLILPSVSLTETGLCYAEKVNSPQNVKIVYSFAYLMNLKNCLKVL